MKTDPQPDFLATQAARSETRARAARESLPESELRRRMESVPPPPPLRLSPGGFDLIAEVKRRSPAVGRLAADALEPDRQARAYADAGAAALSVLTEPEEFRGSLADLASVTASVSAIPAMRKDFLVDPYQVLEARAAGAGGVLLVAACLEGPLLARMLAETLELGMFALVEVFDRRDLEHCVPAMEAAGPALGDDGSVRQLLGVNCRDLRSLVVDFRRFAEFAPQLPDICPTVAESGIAGPDDAAAVAGMGYRLALVGTALMRAGDPRQAAAGLLDAGRRAAA